MEQTPKEERTERVARYLLDRLIQDLTPKLLPILKNGNRLRVEINHGTDRSVDDPIKLSVTEFVN